MALPIYNGWAVTACHMLRRRREPLQGAHLVLSLSQGCLRALQLSLGAGECGCVPCQLGGKVGQTCGQRAL